MLKINKNGIDVKVGEITNINGKEVFVIGDYERDLILRTKGNIKLQIQNKFFDLNQNQSLNINETNSLIRDTSQPLENGFLYHNDQEVFLRINDSNIYLTNNSNNFLSFNTEQNLISNTIVLRNLGLSFEDILDFENSSISFKKGQSVYLEDPAKHFIYTLDGLKEQYLSLTGGNVLGKTSFGNLSDLSFNNTLTIYSKNKDGLYIGDLTNQHNYIFNVDGKLTFTNTHEFGGFEFYNNQTSPIISIEKNRIGLNEKPSLQYEFVSNLESAFRKDIIVLKEIKSNSYETDFNKSYEYEQGFKISKQGDWNLEIDSILVKNPSTDIYTKGIGDFTFLNSGYRILRIEEIERKEVYIPKNLTGRYINYSGNKVNWSDRGNQILMDSLEIDGDPFIMNISFGIGDYRNNNLVSYNSLDINGISYYSPQGSFVFDSSIEDYVPDVNGTHNLTDVIKILDLDIYNINGLEVGDLLIYTEKEEFGEIQYNAFLEIIDITEEKVRVISYNNLFSSLYREIRIYKIGNSIKEVSSSIIIDGKIVNFSNIRSFNELFEEFYLEGVYTESYWFNKIKIPENKIINSFFDNNLVSLNNFSLGNHLVYDNGLLVISQVEELKLKIEELEQRIEILESLI